jgi:uncharacterized protein (DUF2236 family)
MIGGVRDRLGEALFLRVAGPDGPEKAARIHGTEGPRWFAPDSAIATVHGDASMFVGGIRALLMQTLHPAAMLAVAEHSGYRGDMWGRLHRTSTFLATTTFGAAEDAQRSVDIVKAIHKRVVGLMPDGTAYAASDPHLLRWVHVAEVDSFLLSHTVYGREPLDQAEALEEFRPELRGTPEAREAVRYLLLRPPLPLAARPPYGVLAAAAVGLMPRWTRRHLRLPYLPVTERLVVRTLGQAATGTIRWAMSPRERPTTDASTG